SAALAIATGPMVATRCARLRRAGDRHRPDGGDPLRPAPPRWRSPPARWWRPAAPGSAALAIATGPMVATRCARLRRAGDRHRPDGGDPLRPAPPRWRSPPEPDGVDPPPVLGRWAGPRQLGVVVPVR